MPIDLDYANPLGSGGVQIEHAVDSVRVTAPPWPTSRLVMRLVPLGLATLAGLAVAIVLFAINLRVERSMVMGLILPIAVLIGVVFGPGIACWRGIMRRNQAVVIQATAEYLALSTPTEDKVIHAPQIGSIRVRWRLWSPRYVVRAYGATFGFLPIRINRLPRPVDLLALPDRETAQAVADALSRCLELKRSGNRGFEVIVKEPHR